MHRALSFGLRIVGLTAAIGLVVALAWLLRGKDSPPSFRVPASIPIEPESFSDRSIEAPRSAAPDASDDAGQAPQAWYPDEDTLRVLQERALDAIEPSSIRSGHTPLTDELERTILDFLGRQTQTAITGIADVRCSVTHCTFQVAGPRWESAAAFIKALGQDTLPVTLNGITASWPDDPALMRIVIRYRAEPAGRG